ncbi:MAG: cytochrome c oxidase subunit 3 [Methylacidiphilales bacterium]|nr:cytochrome c oxidase subunit 3 [Candidatus Methylacidiphilales bacterium]
MKSEGYFVPHHAYWPIVGSIALFMAFIGASNWLNGNIDGSFLLFGGLILLLVMIFGWFSKVVAESEAAMYNSQVDRSFRWGMAWFIISEIFFFAGFFGALFYIRQFSLPWISGEGHGFYTFTELWNSFVYTWPSNGPAGLGGDFKAMPPWGIPAINTALLLTSGVTITLAHHALKENHRKALVLWMMATILLGVLFVGLQGYEYYHAWSELNLTLSSGAYGSTFYLLTGFHGFHVTIGAIMLIVVTFRCALGHFKPESHFAFEAVAWYWHFVDVVWLGLFVFVYWL